jgi:hypothetical protein
MLTSKMRRVIPTSSWVIFKRTVRFFTRATSSELGLHLLLPLPTHHCFINPTSHVQIQLDCIHCSSPILQISYHSHPRHISRCNFQTLNTYKNTCFSHQETIKLSPVLESPHTPPSVLAQIPIILLSRSLTSIEILNN